MKLFLAIAAATLCLHAQAPTRQPAPKPDTAVQAHLTAVKLVELSGARDRIVASLPDMIEQGKAAVQKQCPDCNPAFFAEWGKRMSARLKVDDFLNVAVRAYENRFTNEELTELLAVVSARTAEKPISLSPALQRKLSDLLPAIMGEITGGCTEIGAKLGAEIGAEIEKEHPEYASPKPKSE